MGWGKMLLLGDWGQQMDIQEQKAEIESLKMQVEANSDGRVSDTLRARIAQVEIENAELRLYLAALVRYLGHKGVLRPDEFRSLVESIDNEDGNRDGGFQGSILK